MDKAKQLWKSGSFFLLLFVAIILGLTGICNFGKIEFWYFMIPSIIILMLLKIFQKPWLSKKL